MQLDFIRAAFNSPITWNVEPVFAASFQDECVSYKDVIHAAVFIALVQRSTGLHVIFTRRASHLYDHAGQISFPGGRIESDDSDAVAAALRETREEIGIGPEFIEIIGTPPSFLKSTRLTKIGNASCRARVCQSV